ncbi:MAG: Rrf2 family transcriptional regulator [Verrucomicrobia bacterium]|nr:MAG: Rrf2 family transcriptional regulator [Verrucomicrobiota bacterium]
MILLSRKVEYGLMALMHLAGAATVGRPVSAVHIARRHRIPGALLGKVMQALTRAGLVESVAGMHGGYQLRRKPAQVALGQVIAAVDGPIQLAGCQAHDACPQSRGCCVRAPLNRVRGEVIAPFSRITLADLRDEQHGKPSVKKRSRSGRRV